MLCDDSRKAFRHAAKRSRPTTSARACRPYRAPLDAAAGRPARACRPSAEPFEQSLPKLAGCSGSPTIVAPPHPSGFASMPHPTPQYGQVVRTAGGCCAGAFINRRPADIGPFSSNRRQKRLRLRGCARRAGRRCRPALSRRPWPCAWRHRRHRCARRRRASPTDRVRPRACGPARRFSRSVARPGQR